MSNTIWKFPIKVTESQYVEMPVGAKVLTVQTQCNLPWLWALVDEDAPKSIRAIDIFGTGFEIPKNYTGKYIGTFQLLGGATVFHLFERADENLH
jgi:hypothetical protein